ncbi:MAG TPA: EamA family transporter [Vicinamibacterales bacterium]|nr:EamA family transporter [Vicinamibacterales bacterium]
MSPRGLSTRQKALVAWLAVCVIWGTTYLGIRISIETLPPFLMAGVRWVVAGALLAALVRANGRPFPVAGARRGVVITGLLLLVVGNGGVVWAEQFVTSGLTAVIIASSPFWMVTVDALRGGERVTGRTLLGLTVGFAGIVLLVWPALTAGGSEGRGFLAGVIALQIACAGWALGSSLAKRLSQQQDIFATTAVQMISAGVVLLLIGTVAGEWRHLHFSVRSSSALVYLIFVGSIAAYGAYAYALKHLPVALVSLYAYINPIIAVALGMIVLDEPFDARMAAAAAIVLVGVALVHRSGGARSGVPARKAAAV